MFIMIEHCGLIYDWTLWSHFFSLVSIFGDWQKLRCSLTFDFVLINDLLPLVLMSFNMHRSSWFDWYNEKYKNLRSMNINEFTVLLLGK